MKITRINSLLLCAMLLLSSISATVFAKHHGKIQGHYFLIDHDVVNQAYKLTFKPNKQVTLFGDLETTGQWQWTPEQQLHIQLDRPLTQYEQLMAENETHVYRLTALTINTQNQGQDTHYTQHIQIWHKEAQKVLRTYTQTNSAKLMKQRQLKKWQTQLVNKTWDIEVMDEVTHDDVPWFKAASTARVTFNDDGTGSVQHWDNTQSTLTWKVRGKRLILQYHSGDKPIKYVLRVIDYIDDIGLSFVAKQVNKTTKSARWLHGLMIEKQDIVLTHEQVVGQWHAFGRYHDYYPDQIAVANIAHTASQWSIDNLGQLNREKLDHPELGTVLRCPDNSCYVSCQFYYELLAKKGNTLYVNFYFYSEFYPQGPLKMQGKRIIKVEVRDQLGANAFSDSFLGYTNMTLESEGESIPYFFNMMPTPDGHAVSEVTSPQGTGTFSIIDGKLHTLINEQKMVYEMTQFRRDGIEVCYYPDGQSCLTGHSAVFKFSHDAGPYIED
ncbi:hypothetical protein A7985_13370 [Pseudoalteromonas luteoviolacea]|uniref:Uncharacterized protein n=1 Tax=Pseudoalteromonas luteoviolacea TaxID=43657 RepID=A0A1C0TPI9_9GAMM|nr:hypothetical protein [Pseudoalteromonas luteoviolacea]OCQ20785.1 hypothetical protein A7985_13370 [Pseudoalteromonas luteoviolacea]